MEHAPAAPASTGAASDVFLFFLSSFIWGTTWLAMKFQLGVVAPGVSVAWRFALASLLLLFGLNDVLVYRADQHLASGLVAVVFSFLVFLNLIGERFFFGTPTPPAVVPSNAFAMGYAALAAAAWCAVGGVPFTFDARPACVHALACLALFGSVVAFMAFLTLLERTGAGRSGYTAAVIPLIAMLASTLLEGYRWSAAPVAGMLLVLSGTVLVLRAKERAA